MDFIKRLKLSINAYVKNDATTSAVVSALTGKDYSNQNIFEIASQDKLLPGLIPFLGMQNKKSTWAV